MGVAFSRANFIRAAVAVAGVKGEGGIKESEVARPRLPSAAFSFLEATKLPIMMAWPWRQAWLLCSS